LHEPQAVKKQVLVTAGFINAEAAVKAVRKK